MVIGELAYADDLVFFVKGKANLTAALRAVEKWTTGHNMETNKSKSGIMKLRLLHDPKPKQTECNGYPYVDEYKYLGITFNSAMTTRLETGRRKVKV